MDTQARYLTQGWSDSISKKKNYQDLNPWPSFPFHFKRKSEASCHFTISVSRSSYVTANNRILIREPDRSKHNYRVHRKMISHDDKPMLSWLVKPISWKGVQILRELFTATKKKSHRLHSLTGVCYHAFLPSGSPGFSRGWVKGLSPSGL